ncbi:MAG: enoyl-[acyl-carrier-protein] reductase [Verrucomicrobia bacterium]|nr:enoyl-[acyl-carrier-protein] reductase [Verrucomicrobiota bacterium]
MKEKSLLGKRAFIAGVGDDQGYGFAIAKALAEEGATILFGTWTPILKIFQTSWDMGKFDASRKLSDGTLLQVEKVYALDALFDTPEEVPEDVRNNKRYQGVGGYTVSEVAKKVEEDFGSIDILVHSLANGPEVKKPLLETSRAGYLAAISSSSYSFVSLVKHFGPFMPPNSSALTLSYIAAERVIPGYGGGMSSAKAALESDTKTLAFEAGQKWQIRINCISAGPLSSRAARAIGFIDKMIDYSKANAPLEKDLWSDEVGAAAAFLLSEKASAITGVTLYVDNGLHAMGLALNSPSIATPILYHS